MMINKNFKKVYAFLLIIIFFFPIKNIFSQTGVSLATEIQNVERAVQSASNSVERHASLVRLARLRQLSGDIEGAARNWLEAAAAIPGTVDDDALLSCALCLAAMGEWDRASAALEPLLLKNIRASFLNTGIRAIKTGDTSMLDVIADNPEYSSVKHEILFLLWKISNGEAAQRWRNRLAAEFPQSPEGRLAANNLRGSSETQLTMSPNPFWFFVSGLDSLPLLASERGSLETQRTANREQSASNREQNPANREVSREQSVTSQTAPAAHAALAAQSSAKVPETSLRVQTGVFSREANANTQASNLRQAGFTPSIEQRVSNNTPMWAVTVSAGADANQTIANLRAAGFEGFLIR
ncbi:MAG: SPOR domain-containing protein [Treponema sp.]|nr:SPOR domain-containing protein [Treponema sp.]MCL2252447.1 SPOR domain-containing protein [Treponema sp.]